MSLEAKPTLEIPAALPLRVLVLDDDRTILATLSRLMDREGWQVVTATNIDEAEAALKTTVPDVAVVDVYLGKQDGLSFVRDFRRRQADVGIIVISAEDTQSLAEKASESGADGFLSKPIAPAALLLTAQKLGQLRQERQRSENLQRELQRSMRESFFPEIVTNCDAMRAVLRLVEKVGPRDLSVLVCGESGTGKELIARGIHTASSRSKGPFIELNCAALPPNLVESELFGHERGAFTGAVVSRSGKIQQASGGTLFLDEIGELPLEIQPKLLRALQERKIVPIGGKESVSCDFRLISATNRDLVEEVREGRFREDLFYRVAVFPIKLPPVRERLEDLDLLLMHFLSVEGMKNPYISPEARLMLHEHRWPGNVRELKNFAQAITLFAEDSRITEESLRTYFGSRLQGPLDIYPPPGNNQPGRRPVRNLEQLQAEEIEYALLTYEGNVSEAARALGMGRATLYKYIKRTGLDLTKFGGTPSKETAEMM